MSRLALIAGSGFGDLAGDAPGQVIVTAYGAPSSPVRSLEFAGQAVAVLSRHGDDHSIPPHRINYRANLAALALLGVRQVIALNTVGVIAPGIRPGTLAVPGQLIDYTYGRDHSIYDGESGSLDHIDFTEPFSGALRERILHAAAGAGVDCHDGGAYAVTQGPRLETAAEVDRLARDGADFIGMTAMPEAAIARELGLEYACLSLIVNFAAGRGEKTIHADIEDNLTAARNLSLRVLRRLFEDFARADDGAA